MDGMKPIKNTAPSRILKYNINSFSSLINFLLNNRRAQFWIKQEL